MPRVSTDDVLSPSRADSDVIERMTDLLAVELEAVNATIINNMQSPVALIPQLAGHLIKAGGKRFRPMLTLISARLLNYQGKRHIYLAACVEFIHTATLLHDDVVDVSALRRGLDSANMVWGNHASVLVGDFLFSRAFQLMVADGSLAVLKLLSDTAVTITEGEVHQLRLQNAPNSEEKLYLQVIHGKTAALFAAACGVASLLSDGDSDDSQANYHALYEYGLNLGMAFQIIDDILDYRAPEGNLGKSLGDDFAEGKVTLPLIFAWQSGSAEERTFLTRVMRDKQQSKDDWQEVQTLMDKYDCLQKTHLRAQQYADKAAQSLNHFGDSHTAKIMHEMIEFCLQRCY